MKHVLIALGFALGSNAAAGNTGSINFYGNVDNSTCPIEIFDPQTGLPISRVFMGNVSVSQFKQADDEAASRSFGMRLTPGGSGCILMPGAKASVTFTGNYGGAGSGGLLYALEPGGANGIALTIKDDQGTPIGNDIPSKDYLLHDSMPSDMLFSVAYKATSSSVTAGRANTDVRFLVDIH